MLTLVRDSLLQIRQGILFLRLLIPRDHFVAEAAPAAFLSYCREDSDFALRLAKDLKAVGASVWLDQLDIVLGERWDRAVEDALANCPSMLVILSPASVNSIHVMDEVSFALEEKKTIIPVMYKDCKVPFRLRRLQYVDLRQDYSRGLEGLVKTLAPEQKAGQDAPVTLRGHTESVESVAWSPDGKRLATGSGDKTAKVWNADTGRELLTLRGHRECVRRVEWTWDLEREIDTLVSASMDGWWKVWDADTGKELHEDHAGAEGWLMAWRPAGSWSGNWLAHSLDAASSGDGSGLGGVMVHCLETGEGVILHHRDLVRSIAWSPDGMRLATGTTDGTVRVWNADAGKELLTLRGHGDSVTSLAWDPGGSQPWHPPARMAT